MKKISVVLIAALVVSLLLDVERATMRKVQGKQL